MTARKTKKKPLSASDELLEARRAAKHHRKDLIDACYDVRQYFAHAASNMCYMTNLIENLTSDELCVLPDKLLAQSTLDTGRAFVTLRDTVQTALAYRDALDLVTRLKS